MSELPRPGGVPLRTRKTIPFGYGRPVIDEYVADGRPRPRANSALGVLLAAHIAFDPVWWAEVIGLRPDWASESLA